MMPDDQPQERCVGCITRHSAFRSRRRDGSLDGNNDERARQRELLRGAWEPIAGLAIIGAFLREAHSR